MTKSNQCRRDWGGRHRPPQADAKQLKTLGLTGVLRHVVSGPPMVPLAEVVRKSGISPESLELAESLP